MVCVLVDVHVVDVVTGVTAKGSLPGLARVASQVRPGARSWTRQRVRGGVQRVLELLMNHTGMVLKLGQLQQVYQCCFLIILRFRLTAVSSKDWLTGLRGKLELDALPVPRRPGLLWGGRPGWGPAGGGVPEMELEPLK